MNETVHTRPVLFTFCILMCHFDVSFRVDPVVLTFCILMYYSVWTLLLTFVF